MTIEQLSTIDLSKCSVEEAEKILNDVTDLVGPYSVELDSLVEGLSLHPEYKSLIDHYTERLKH